MSLLWAFYEFVSHTVSLRWATLLRSSRWAQLAVVAVSSLWVGLLWDLPVTSLWSHSLPHSERFRWALCEHGVSLHLHWDMVPYLYKSHLYLEGTFANNFRVHGIHLKQEKKSCTFHGQQSTWQCQENKMLFYFKKWGKLASYVTCHTPLRGYFPEDIAVNSDRYTVLYDEGNLVGYWVSHL